MIKNMIKNNKNINNKFSYIHGHELRSSYSKFSLSKICKLIIKIECNKKTNWIPCVVYKVEDIVHNSMFLYSSVEYDKAIQCFNKISEISYLFDKNFK